MKKTTIILCGLALLAVCLPVQATSVYAAHPLAGSWSFDEDDDESIDSISVDTLTWSDLDPESDTLPPVKKEEEPFKIQVLTRSYGDSIVIRWAPDEYVPWKFLNGYGYVLVRGTDDELSDTIAIIKPTNMYEFAEHYAKTDTMAYAAMQTIYGEATALNNTRSAPGSAGSIMEVYEEQQNIFGFAMVIAELRPDLATDMGLRYVDKDVKPGVTYRYFITPNMSPDILYVRPAFTYVENKPYEPKPCTLELSDSIVSIDAILLQWPYSGDFSIFDIERRKAGQKEWVTVNQKPYMSMNFFEGDSSLRIFTDDGLKPGTYTYRLRGYDSFGDKSAPGPEHTVTLPDLLPPVPPILTHITIERGDSTMTALIEWQKDSIESDLIGYIPFYQFGAEEEDDKPQVNVSTAASDSSAFEGRWVPLVNDRVLAPTDTSVRVDIRGLSTGMVTIAAVDSAMNMTYAMPMPMRITDLEPPLPPTNIRGAISPEGVATIGWHPSVSRDVHYYQLFAANDTTHTFMLVPNMQQYQDTLFNDTLSLEVNQPYKYYKVRAIDWAGNNSKFSEVLRVNRPNFNPPSECFIDTSFVTTDSIYMRWVISPERDLDKIRVFRRLSNERQWTLIRTYGHDRVNGKSTLEVVDYPEPNQTIRYYYAIEAINTTGVSNGLSMQVCYLFQGQTVFDVPIKLEAAWRPDLKQVIITWNLEKELPVIAPHHFVLSRKLEGEDFFRAYRSIEEDQTSFSDKRMKPGETTTYRLEVLYEDGRRTIPSNEVYIAIPKEENRK